MGRVACKRKKLKTIDLFDKQRDGQHNDDPNAVRKKKKKRKLRRLGDFDADALGVDMGPLGLTPVLPASMFLTPEAAQKHAATMNSAPSLEQNASPDAAHDDTRAMQSTSASASSMLQKQEQKQKQKQAEKQKLRKRRRAGSDNKAASNANTLQAKAAVTSDEPDEEGLPAQDITVGALESGAARRKAFLKQKRKQKQSKGKGKSIMVGKESGAADEWARAEVVPFGARVDRPPALGLANPGYRKKDKLDMSKSKGSTSLDEQPMAQARLQAMHAYKLLKQKRQR